MSGSNSRPHYDQVFLISTFLEIIDSDLENDRIQKGRVIEMLSKLEGDALDIIADKTHSPTLQDLVQQELVRREQERDMLGTPEKGA